MASASVRWTGGMSFIGTDSTKHSVVLSTPGEGVGMKPSELLLVAVASCSSVDVVEILEKKKLKLTGLEVQVSAEQESDPPWTFRKIHMHYRVTGSGLTPKAVEQAIRLSEEKYCSVAATVRPTAEITFDFEIIEA
ncbi:MAG: OsmC family protein [Anaerolineae bacterium]|nr:OsmC family protein [Anaerolineae bacterium]